MSYLIACDDGHGMETPGKRTPPLPYDMMFNGKLRKKGEIIHENELNQIIMKKFIEGCKRCGVGTLEVAPTDKDIPLANRVNLANSKDCDLYVSFHGNALEGSKFQTKAYGLVVIIHENCQEKTKVLANDIYEELKDGVKWYSNGATKYGVRKDTDVSGFSLYVLRNTKMPATLVEYGFMDNIEDLKRMVSDEFSTACAESTLKGACKALGAVYKPPVSISSPKPVEVPKNGFYRVLVGAYNDKKYAEQQIKELEKKGIKATIIYTEKTTSKDV